MLDEAEAGRATDGPEYDACADGLNLDDYNTVAKPQKNI